MKSYANKQLILFPLGKITSRGRPEDIHKRHPMDVSYGPLCNAKDYLLRHLPTASGR